MRGDAYHAGPVMLSDVYTSAVGSAKDGVAASQRALYDAYNSLNSSTFKYTSTVSDLDLVTGDAVGVRWSNGTLNTPQKAGVTVSGNGLCITCAGNTWGVQLSLNQAVTQLFIRKKNESGWQSWQTPYPSLDTTTAQTGNMTVGTSHTAWSITVNRSGYTPLMFSPLNMGNSSTIIIHTEQRTLTSGTFKISGYAKSATTSSYPANISTVILWRKN